MLPDNLLSVTAIQGNRVTIVGAEEMPGAIRVEAHVDVEALAGWEVALTIPTTGERSGSVVELTIRPTWSRQHDGRTAPKGGVKAATLRAVPVAEILRASFVDDRHLSIGSLLNEAYPQEATEIVRAAKGGRPPLYDEVFYAEVAIDWERHTAEGGPGALARMAQERREPPSTVKNWVTQATRRGLLHKATGRGPQPRFATAKALEALSP